MPSFTGRHRDPEWRASRPDLCQLRALPADGLRPRRNPADVVCSCSADRTATRQFISDCARPSSPARTSPPSGSSNVATARTLWTRVTHAPRAKIQPGRHHAGRHCRLQTRSRIAARHRSPAGAGDGSERAVDVGLERRARRGLLQRSMAHFAGHRSARAVEARSAQRSFDAADGRSGGAGKIRTSLPWRRACISNASIDLPTHDGTHKWFLAHAKVVRRDAAGKALRVIGVLQDISRSKQDQRTALEVEQRWERAIRGTSDGLYEWNLLTRPRLVRKPFPRHHRLRRR